MTNTCVRRLLTNEHARLMWFTYCGASSDRVTPDTFVMAVGKYLEEQLGMPTDAVEGVLTEECCGALSLARRRNSRQLLHL